MDNSETLKRCEKVLDATSTRIGDMIPYIPNEKKLYEVDMGKKNLAWWTNGFYAGIMWEMYVLTKKDKYQKIAINIEEKFDTLLEAKTNLLDHDIGFLWLHTAVANYRITGNLKSKTRALHAANLLAARFNVAGNYLVAWNHDNSNMIIDSLMNIPLLFWASEETGETRYRLIAEKHLETALKYIIREDGSCNHICRFDPETGEYLGPSAGQGYSVGSSWTRGQAWGVYGFSLAYKYTKDNRFLDAAKKVANYFCSNIVSYNYVSPIDFRAPEEPLYYDITASAIVASGLQELSCHMQGAEANNYQLIAKKILEEINVNYCDYNINTDGIVQKGSAKYHWDKVKPELPIIYGDYFYIEALLKLEKIKIDMW